MCTAKQDVEICLIKEDTHFYLELIGQLNGTTNEGILLLGLQPYFSLFVIETKRYFTSEAQSFSSIFDAETENIIQRSRHSTKLFDDNKYSIDENKTLHNDLAKDHHEYFINKYSSIFEPIMRIFRTDLGLFFYDRYLFCTTHSAQINLGYGELALNEVVDENGSLSYDVGYAMGQYLSIIANVIWDGHIPEGYKFTQYKQNDALIRRKDVLSRKYYQSIIGYDEGLEMIPSIVYVLVPIIFFDQILANLVKGTPNTYFKLKLISLYHFISSFSIIEKLYIENEISSQKIQDLLEKIRAARIFDQIREVRSLRNIFVHYGLGTFPQQKIDKDLQLFGLIEHYFNGASFSTIDKFLNQKIHMLSEIANNWLFN